MAVCLVVAEIKRQVRTSILGPKCVSLLSSDRPLSGEADSLSLSPSSTAYVRYWD